MPDATAQEEKKPIATAIQETAGEKLGVRGRDLTAIYRESADAATDNGLPYWSVLVLSGGIATLGLAMNSSAVVIGAMLVAPLLGPIVGLALALAVGDGRLAIQTGAIVFASTVAVALTGAVLTAVLPFQTITLEISARARPSTIDLAIAIFSGLVGAVVTVARGSRLSAAIPGVAISVALIPPLAVAGFGFAAERNVELIWGSMLLYGANLAGIVLSGIGVFVLVGMHCPAVVEAAHRWHREGERSGLAGLVDRGWVRRLEIQRSPWARIGLVVGFVAALAIPLTDTLAQIARDARVERAVDAAAEEFEVPGSTSILTREIVYGSGRSRVYLRVATTSWFGDEARIEFERAASAAAGEPVDLVLEQLPASGGDIDEFASMLPGRGSPRRAVAAPATTTELLERTRARLEAVPSSITVPDGVAFGGLELAAADDGRATLRATYASPEPLPVQAEEMLSAQLVRSLGLPAVLVLLGHVSTNEREVGPSPDSLALHEIGELVQANGRLDVEVRGGEPADSAQVTAAVEMLAGMGIERSRIHRGTRDEPGVRVRLTPRQGPPPRE